MHGRGVYTWTDGRKYDGEYLNDKKRRLRSLLIQGWAPVRGPVARWRAAWRRNLQEIGWERTSWPLGGGQVLALVR